MSHKGVGFYNINDECDVNAPEATPRKYSKETKKERKKERKGVVKSSVKSGRLFHGFATVCI